LPPGQVADRDRLRTTESAYIEIKRLMSRKIWRFEAEFALGNAVKNLICQFDYPSLGVSQEKELDALRTQQFC
jgi:hypothetical protein